MTASQHFIPIEDIYDNLVFLKDGSVSLVISTSAVNFGLLFETEQISIIESFAGMLNSLSFPIQIIVISRRLDISSYLNVLDKAREKQTNPLLSQMTTHYRRFVEGLIREKNVLDKQFYICLNVTVAELGLLPQKSQDRNKKALIILVPRRDHLIRQLSRIGLKASQLKTVELIKLFYDLFNPQLSGDSEIKQTIPPAKIQSIQQLIQPSQKPVETTPIRRLNLVKPTLNVKTPQPNISVTNPVPPVSTPTPQLAVSPAPPVAAPPPYPQTPTSINRIPFVAEELTDERST